MKLKLLSATFLTLALASTQAATFTVSTTADAGPGSLRQAILDANGSAGGDTIIFATSGTIILASPLPAITDNTTIVGPGTNLMTISGNNAVQVLPVNAGTTCTISALTIANGMATNYANGAGISNAGTLTILNCSLINNQNFGGWGGAIFNSGNLFITNSTLSGNQVTGENGFGRTWPPLYYQWTGSGGGGGAAGLGAGIFSMAGIAIINGCAFIGNSATGGSGGGTNGTGRGGGINGGQGNDQGGPGDPGGYGGGGGGAGQGYNGGRGGFGGGGGGGGCSHNASDPGGNGGQGGFAGGAGGAGGLAYYTGGGGGGGGAGLGAAIFVESGAVTILDSSFPGNQATGGLGGINPRSQSGGNGFDGNNGSGIVGAVFKRTGTVLVQDSVVNIVSTNTSLETWTNGGHNYLAPIGTPEVFADGQIALGNIVKRTSIQVSLQTSYSNGTIVYSLDGSDPRIHSTLYSSPFSVRQSTLLRAVAYNSSFTASVEIDPVPITILPTLTATTPGGGTIAIAPPDGPYFANSVAQITAQPASGCAFLQWLGDASGTNPVTTVTMNRNKYVQAVFGTTLATNVVGGGSLLVDPFLPLYPFGTTVKLTAQPQTGNYFAQWGASVSGTNNPVSFAISNANPSVAAIFSALSGNKYALTVIESGHGHVLENPRANAYSNGQSVSLTALPDSGQVFIAWSGDASGTQNPLLVTVSLNKVITANFTKRPALRVGTPLEGLDENGFRMTILGDFGVSYSILGSTNLSDWTAIGTVTNTYGTIQLTDPEATNLAYRFYRAASQ